MFLLLPSIAAFFLYRHLMRQADLLTGTSRGTQAQLPLQLRRCGPTGLLAVGVSLLFFLMMILQYGCIFLSGFLKLSKGS